MAKQVKYAKLHQGIFVAGVGNVGDTLPPSSKNFPDWKMTKVADGVDCQARSAPGAPLVEFWVPSANIAILTYASSQSEAVAATPAFDTAAKPIKVSHPPKDVAADTKAFEAAVKAEKEAK